MAAQRVEDIARVFGTGFKRLFSIAHELIIKSGHSNESIKLRGQWVDIDPTQWRTGRDMRVVAPFAAGNKDSLLQRLQFIAQIHEKALAGGLPIVDVEDSYNLALEIAHEMHRLELCYKGQELKVHIEICVEPFDKKGSKNA